MFATHSKCVEISHVASLVGMSQPALEEKLRQLIQDGKLQGILDQGEGQLIVTEKPASSTKPSKNVPCLLFCMTDIILSSSTNLTHCYHLAHVPHIRICTLEQDL